MEEETKAPASETSEKQESSSAPAPAPKTKSKGPEFARPETDDKGQTKGESSRLITK